MLTYLFLYEFSFVFTANNAKEKEILQSNHCIKNMVQLLDRPISESDSASIKVLMNWSVDLSDVTVFEVQFS